MGNPLLLMQLTTGSIIIECRPDKAPHHVAQVLATVDAGHYDGIPFHRVIDAFMAQGGATGKHLPQLMAEFNDYPHIMGACSMARTDDPNSASDQFFICLAHCPWLDGQYSVWGQVIYGMEHVHSLPKGEPSSDPGMIIKVRRLLV